MDGLLALHKAAEHGDREEVRRLLTGGTVVDERDEYGQSALHAACREGREDTVVLLLKAGASPTLTDLFGQTPLHEAARANHSCVAQIVLRYGAAVDIRDNDGWTPLHLAAINNNALVASVLVQYGAQPLGIPNKEGKTPVDLANSSEMKRILGLSTHKPCDVPHVGLPHIVTRVEVMLEEGNARILALQRELLRTTTARDQPPSPELVGLSSRPKPV